AWRRSGYTQWPKWVSSAVIYSLTLQRHLIYSLATPVLGGRCNFAILAHSDALQSSLDLHLLLPRRRAAPSRATSEGEVAGCSGHDTFEGEIEAIESIFYYQNCLVVSL